MPTTFAAELESARATTDELVSLLSPDAPSRPSRRYVYATLRLVEN